MTTATDRRREQLREGQRRRRQREKAGLRLFRLDLPEHCIVELLLTERMLTASDALDPMRVDAALARYVADRLAGPRQR